jgi:hypothetical protein
MLARVVALGSALPLLGLSFALAQQTLVVPDNLFTQAGFVVKYATTPEKSALLRSLPKDKLVTRRKDGKLYYVYADAARCNCAYVGTPEACGLSQLDEYRSWRRRRILERHGGDRFRSRGSIHSRRHWQQHGQHPSTGFLTRGRQSRGY